MGNLDFENCFGFRYSDFEFRNQSDRADYFVNRYMRLPAIEEIIRPSEAMKIITLKKRRCFLVSCINLKIEIKKYKDKS
jgi:hypothetical protein